MKPILSVRNIAKQYRLGTIGTGTIREDLERWWHRVRGKQDPYLVIGEENDRQTRGKSDYVWALKDINFEVMPGDVLGIIGKNGAGKSTLLKILSKVTGPTAGRIDYNGRIGSLLEVGTGFHPELTGLENIFLNGAILGMTKREIRSKLDEIIEFSGCERYIDTPVKRYSSGMIVRLGFAVAAHLDPEILIVDEVLAVGDAEFQKRAIGKMQAVSQNEGRTVLFVSHNLGAVKQLCTKGVILQNGRMGPVEPIDKAVDSYLGIANAGTDKNIRDLISLISPDVRIEEVLVNGSPRQKHLVSGHNTRLEVSIRGHLAKPARLCFELLLMNEYEVPIAIYNPDFSTGTVRTFPAGDFRIHKTIILPDKLNKGNLVADISLTEPLKEFFVKIPKALLIECEGYANPSGFTYIFRDGGVNIIN